MTDRQWPDVLEVEFDARALHHRRMAALRSQRVAAWGWLGLTVLILVAIIVPLFRSSIPGLRYLAIAWCLLIAGAALVAVRSFVTLFRCSSWKDGRQPKTALRLSREGLWLTGLRRYSWTDIRRIQLRTTFGRARLVVDLRSGVTPDSPTTVGLNELLPPTRRRRLLPPRGPRVLLESLASQSPSLSTAIHHYSNGQITVT
jgi:hypothetical protein